MQYNLDNSNWVFGEDVFNINYTGKCESIMCQGNGYLCARAATEENYINNVRNTFVSGTFNKFGEEVTELPNVPDVIAMPFVIDGDALDLSKGTIKEYIRKLNLQNGLLERSFNWTSPNGTELHFVFKRIVSFKHKHLIAQEVQITPINKDASIKLSSGINGQLSNSGSQHFLEGEKRCYDSKYMQYLCETSESKIDFVINTVHGFGKLEKAPEQLIVIDRRKIYMKYSVGVKRGETFKITKFSNVHTTRDAENEGLDINALKSKSLDELKSASEKSFETLLEESASVWQELWDKKDIKIIGNDFDQLAIRFAIYHLAVMSPVHDNRMNIGAKGLSGEGYKGHAFWDTEIFMLPHFIYSDPKSARSLLEYRYNCIEGARRKAKEYNCEGAMYPWESAWIEDGEVTPLYGAADIITGEASKIWTGIIELHITSDVAFGVYHYYTVSGDHDFMEKYGYEIILDTAKFWQSRLEYNKEKDRYEINNVIGPDEYKEHVNNDAFTNYMAHWNIRLAMEYYTELKMKNNELFQKLNAKLDLDRVYKSWQEKLDKIFLPKADENKIVPQNDTFMSLPPLDLSKYKASDVVGTIYNDYNGKQINQMQVIKQADVLVLFYLLEDLFDKETKCANFYFYEDKCLHDSSLSLSTHSVLASDLHENEMAYKLFERACRIDLGPVMTTSDHGIHAASFGGIWQCVVNGFAGVRMVGGKLRISPNLPENYSEIESKIYWKGQQLRINVTKTEMTIENLTGTDEVRFIHKDKEHVFKDKITLSLKPKAFIFDLDGVLTDTALYHFEAWKELSQELGFKFDENDNERLKGVSRTRSFEIILEINNALDRFKPEEVEAYANKKNQRYVELIKKITPSDVLPGVMEFLNTAKAAGIKLAVASASKNAFNVLDSLGIANMFDYIADAAKIKNTKPDPEVFLDCCKNLGLIPSECVGFEDAQAGIEAIHAAGMRSVGINVEVKTQAPDIVLKSTNDLKNVWDMI